MSKTTDVNSNPESFEKFQDQALQASDKRQESLEVSSQNPHQDRKNSQKVAQSTQDETPSSLSAKRGTHVPDQPDRAPQRNIIYLESLHPLGFVEIPDQIPEFESACFILR